MSSRIPCPCWSWARCALSKYFDQAKKLLPQGLIWGAAKTGKLAAVLDVPAGQMSVCHDRADNLMMEAIPTTALELLPEWEKFAGLPDECTIGYAETIEERRRAVVAKLTGRPTLSLQSFIDLAEMLGYKISIREYIPFTAGRSRCGGDHVLVSPHSPFIAGASRCGGPPNFGGLYARYHWRVTIVENRVHLFRTGRDKCGTKLGYYKPAKDLECFLKRRKSAHTRVFFEYLEILPHGPTHSRSVAK